VQNLFTSLLDTAVVFYFYLELQNSEFSKTSWVGSQIQYLIFCQKFSIRLTPAVKEFPICKMAECATGSVCKTARLPAVSRTRRCIPPSS
jgi:hypothetical protein